MEDLVQVWSQSNSILYERTQNTDTTLLHSHDDMLIICDVGHGGLVRSHH